jgi:uncharacterized membrane protein YbhN (UPF0104 family)
LLKPAIIGVSLIGAWLLWRIVPWLAARIRRQPAQVLPRRPQHGGLWGATMLLYVGFWLLQGDALVAIAHTLCGGLTLGLFDASAAFAVAWAIGFLIVFVPAGLGVREWTLGALLVAFAGLQPGQATLLAVISRLGLIVAELGVLAIGLHGQIQKSREERIRRWTSRE